MSMERKGKNQESTFLWLKFLVLISFLCFAGLFDHPKLDTKEHDHHKTRDKYQYWKESKIGWTSNSKNKMTNWGSLHPPSPIPHYTRPASIRRCLKTIDAPSFSRRCSKTINFGRKPKTVSFQTTTTLATLRKFSQLLLSHLSCIIQYFNIYIYVHIYYSSNIIIFLLQSFNTVILQ